MEERQRTSDIEKQRFIPPFSDSIIDDGTSKPFTPPFALPKASTPKRFMPAEEAVAYEHVQFERWLKMFKNPGKDGVKPRLTGSKRIFAQFIRQMMPLGTRGEWVANKQPYLFVMTDADDKIIFRYEGTQRHIFEKLVQHYGNHRRIYFEQRHHTKLPKRSFSDIVRRGLAPPPKPEIQIKEVEVPVVQIKEVEVPVNVEVEVPGKAVDRLQKALTDLPSQVKEILDGHKRLPNQFRHIYDNIKVMTEGDGMIHVSLVLGP